MKMNHKLMNNNFTENDIAVLRKFFKEQKCYFNSIQKS